jgi:hypothetical protein
MGKVRVHSHYYFNPNCFDTFSPAHRGLRRGDKVKVVNLRGCPPANTMGQCYVERDGVFMGMVSTSSLQKEKVI